jgi:hypothetical protein
VPRIIENSHSTETSIHSLIEAGLRAKLEAQSFVTGQLLVAFDFYPDTPVSLMGFKDDMQELPTLPSDMEALAKTFDTIDFPAVAESISNAAKGIDELANSPELREAVASVNDTVKALWPDWPPTWIAMWPKLSTELTADHGRHPAVGGNGRWPDHPHGGRGHRRGRRHREDHCQP